MQLTEFELIRLIKKSLLTAPVDMVRGIGEDCAVVKKDDESVFLISTDSLIEKVHFDLKSFSFLELGKKALSVNLSDIAAMAGKPLYAFVSLGIPDSIQKENIQDFYQGLEQVANEFSTAIVGGDTSRSPSLFFINITVVGVAKNNGYKLRSDAMPGDGIYVSGDLGDAALGLKALQKNKAQKFYDPVQALKNPRPRLYLAEVLSEFEDVHAVIDLSDGLVQDLQHILYSSKVSAKILCDLIPSREGFAEECRQLKLDPLETALAGGEDYQLLFTMNPRSFEELTQKAQLRNLKITQIGEVMHREAFPSGDNLEIYLGDQKLKLDKFGFDHFKKA